MNISQESSRASSVSSHGGRRERSGRPRGSGHVHHAGGRPRRTLPGNIIDYLLFCNISITKL
jgi:hypothetical protein